jgi:Flp pilus assembly protein TadG
VIVASDGTKAAPNAVRVVWPLDTSTPWAGPLIIAGLALLVVGLGLYLWGLYALRKSRGPRRKGGPKMPKLPKAPKYKPSKAVEATPKGRRSTRRAMIAVPVVLVGALGLTGCTSEFWSQPQSAPSATVSPIASDLPKSKDVMPPAVTVPQLERIMKRISATATQADAKADPKLLTARFTGPALQLRAANYAVRAKKADVKALPAIAAGPLAVSLPQATDTWPRTVTTVVKPDQANQAPIALALVQKTPRDNYQVQYAVSLEPKAKVPDLAPASIGAAVVPPDSKLLKLPPKDVAAAYADILVNGDKSTFAPLFDANGDTLRVAVGSAYKAKAQSTLEKTASLAFSHAIGTEQPIAMATNDSGAIVWASMTETEALRVVEAGAEVGAGPTSAALSGVTSSKTGIDTTYGYQLAFYVPKAGSDAKITLLGFAQGLVAAKEVK